MDTAKLQKILELVFGAELSAKLEVTPDNTLNLEVAEDKVAFLIGKQGRNIKAIRELVYLYNKLHETDYRLEIVNQ